MAYVQYAQVLDKDNKKLHFDRDDTPSEFSQ